MLRASVFFACVAALGAICAAHSPAQDGKKPDIKGEVKKLTLQNVGANPRVLATMLVEGPQGQPYDKAMVRITPQTKLLKMKGKEAEKATVKDLKEGQTVAIQFTGPVAESYPVQAAAGELIILMAAEEKK